MIRGEADTETRNDMEINRDRDRERDRQTDRQVVFNGQSDAWVRSG